MLKSELSICELCGSTFKSCTSVEICSTCSKGAGRKLPGTQKSLDDAKLIRQLATSIGLKALIGSAKQKSWGESIRKKLIENLSKSLTVSKVDCTSIYAILTSPIFKFAKFWINWRNNLIELQEDLIKAVQLKDKANFMHANEDSNSAEYQVVADQYHAIIAKFESEKTS